MSTIHQARRLFLGSTVVFALSLLAPVAVTAEDEVAVSHHARVHDDDPVGVADEAHRAGNVRHAHVALDEDVDAGGSRQLGHAADASNRAARSAL